MKLRKLTSLVLSLAMVLSFMALPTFAADAGATAPTSAAKTFPDTVDHWAEKAIGRWAGYGVVKGDEAGKFNPDADLTRASLATILADFLKLSTKAKNEYTDVPADAWFADAVLKCTAAGIMKGSEGFAKPNDNITRQEAVVMIGRALGVAPAAKADLAGFTDGATVADWAAGYVTAMTKGGIVAGVGENQIAPLVNINRASILSILDRAVSDYIAAPGTYSKVVGTGIVAVVVPDVVLKGNKIAGSLLVAEGLGDGNLTLDGTHVAGKMTVRGGGVNSIIIKGGSKLGDVTIARVDGAVRIVTSGGSTIETTYIDDGKDNVILEGKLGNVSVACEVPVTLKGADVKTVTATGKNADITVDAKSKVVTVATAQENTKITVAGTVNTVAATAEAKGVALNVAKGGTATSVTTAATGSTITNEGKVTGIAVAKGADTKYVAGAGTTLPKVTAEDKTNVTATTVAAEKAAADKAAAEKLAAAATTEAEKKAAETAKAAADKAAADAKKADDKLKTDVKVDEKPVTPPTISTDKPGEVVVPKPIEPEKPQPQPQPEPEYDPYTYVSTPEALTAALANPSVSYIAISGTLGSTDTAKGYTAYHVARPVTIKGGTVYGSFIITADGVTVQGVTMYTQGGPGGPLKNCIDAFTKAVTITGCTFNLSARTDGSQGAYLGNGIVVWPYGSATVAVTISGNTFNELQSQVPTWDSSAIQVVEGLAINVFSAYGIKDGTTMESIDLPNEDAIAAGNTYTNCDNAYVHSNWSTPGEGTPKIYEYTYAETATQLADGLLYAVADGATVKLGKDVTLTAGIETSVNNLTLDGNGKTITFGEGFTLVRGRGLLFQGDDLTIKNLTINAASKAQYPLAIHKFNVTPAMTNAKLIDVTVNGAGKTAIDILGVDGLVLTNVSATAPENGFGMVLDVVNNISGTGSIESVSIHNKFGAITKVNLANLGVTKVVVEDFSQKGADNADYQWGSDTTNKGNRPGWAIFDGTASTTFKAGTVTLPAALNHSVNDTTITNRAYKVTFTKGA